MLHGLTNPYQLRQIALEIHFITVGDNKAYAGKLKQELLYIGNFIVLSQDQTAGSGKGIIHKNMKNLTQDMIELEDGESMCD